MNALRSRYFETLKANDLSKRKRALNRAYQLRTFEIEHYWKRATYFWGFQIAIFAAFGLLWKTDYDSKSSSLITVALSGLGVLTAAANSLSARGSKFWQQNWERHIDMLEDDIEGRLHKTIWLPEGKISFSVSGTNQTLSYLIIVFWVVVTVYVAYKYVGSPPLDFDYLHNISAWWRLIIITVVVAFGVGWLLRQTSRLPGTLPKPDGNHGDVPIKRFSRWHRRISPDQTFMRRYAPDEPNNDADTTAE
jgi:hypothetical protein